MFSKTYQYHSEFFNLLSDYRNGSHSLKSFTPKKDKVKPGKSLCYHISYEFDPSEKHKWKFQSSDGSVVSGLDDYVCIKKALRNYKGKSQVTIDEVKKIEKDQKKRFKKFLKEEKK